MDNECVLVMMERGKIFHVKTGFVLFALACCSASVDSKAGKSVTDIAYDSTRDETRTILFVRRSSVSNSRHLRSRGNPVMFLACGLVGYLFFTNHHQPSAYSRKLHNYYSVLVVLFGFIRSLWLRYMELLLFEICRRTDKKTLLLDSDQKCKN